MKKLTDFALKATIVAALTTLAVGGLRRGWNPDPKPRVVGEFEYQGLKMTVVKSGDCMLLLSPGPQQAEPRIFINCKN